MIKEALEYASMGLVPGGAHKNREFREAGISFSSDVQTTLQDVLFDPQTSGGLLICVRDDQAESLVRALQEAKINSAALVGEILDDSRERIEVI